jgi:hypothetical protein
VNHVFDGIFVIFAQVNDTSVSLTKTIAACAVEEAAAGAQNGLVDGPLAVIAGDGQVRIFSAEVESVDCVSTAHDGELQIRSLWSRRMESVGEY